VPLADDDPAKLGANLGFSVAAVARLADPAAAYNVTPTP
jgi:hypothetical protein